MADFNHDGKLDLVTANGDSNNSVSVLLGNGDGSFQAPISYASGVGEIDIVVADFDGDGNPDVAVGAGQGLFQGGSVALLLGNGDGTFRPGPTFAHVGPGVAAGDVNGDGKIDLVTTADGPVRVFLGEGNGNFQQGLSYSCRNRSLLGHVNVSGRQSGNGLDYTRCCGAFEIELHVCETCGTQQGEKVSPTVTNGSENRDVAAAHEAPFYTLSPPSFWPLSPVISTPD